MDVDRTDKARLDDREVKNIRRLLAEGGNRAVEKRFGEQVTATAEQRQQRP